MGYRTRVQRLARRAEPSGRSFSFADLRFETTAWLSVSDAGAVPTQRNSRNENAELQAGRTPAGWKQKPAKVRQKDRDARWTKKHGRSFFGYKNHVNADAKHKLIRHYAVTDAAVHDSQELEGLLDRQHLSTRQKVKSARNRADPSIRLLLGTRPKKYDTFAG